MKRGSSSYKNVLTVIPLQSYKTTKIVFNVYAISTLLNRIEIIIICFIIPHFQLLFIYVVISFMMFENWLNGFNFDLIWFLVFNATFNNISFISWRPVLVVEEAGVPEENHRPWTSNW